MAMLLPKKSLAFSRLKLRPSMLSQNRNKLLSAAQRHFQVDSESKYFEHNSVEERMYKWWEESGFLQPNATSPSNETFCIAMPPPNVTGSLHIGHALGLAIQDLLTRFNRMKGKNTLWIPGTDHAGIATQLQVENALHAEGTSRQQVGREGFLKRAFEWKSEKASYIVQQMKRIGISADWSREQFTLSESLSEAVAEAFVRLHQKGLIYKGKYMVNWCPKLQTAVSDLEVEYFEEQGRLYHFRYQLADGSGFIPVATTRPETILGDTAVCVHPDDNRYKQFVGKRLIVPFANREIPVIADEYVDMQFGTGALKITPSHDVNDFQLGLKHNLDTISIFNKDASMNSNAGKYVGLDREECRRQIWDDLHRAGLSIEAKPHMQRIPRSQRGGAIIEPMISEQWFVRTQRMAERALRSVSDGDLKIVPPRFQTEWEGWLTGIHDWCISRQLWWGHRIPAYYINGSREAFVVAKNSDEALQIARSKYGENVSIQQEEDVLDTWFSSGLWPFAINGWPNTSSNADLETYYPTSSLVTGYDILFFWVARMSMLGLELTDSTPFKTVYLHGLVRDGDGNKMSKTKGNVIDPLEAVSQFGCDSLRHTLLSSVSAHGLDVPISNEKLEMSRNFINKLWNIGKFIKLRLDKTKGSSLEVDLLRSNSFDLSSFPLAEQYIIIKCTTAMRKVTASIEAYKFAEAESILQDFIWNEFANWYLEISKTRGSNNVESETRSSLLLQSNMALFYVWDSSLRALHPFIPFITESMWQTLHQQFGSLCDGYAGSVGRPSSIMISRWPSQDTSCQAFQNSFNAGSDCIEASFDIYKDIVTAIRNIRAEYKAEPGKKIPAVVKVSLPPVGSTQSNESIAARQSLLEFLASEKRSLSFLAGLDEQKLVVVEVKGIDEINEVGGCDAGPLQTAHAVIRENVHLFIPIHDMIDVGKELNRLQRAAEALQKDVAALRGRVNNVNFMSKASPTLIQETKKSLREKLEKLEVVQKTAESYARYKI